MMPTFPPIHRRVALRFAALLALGGCLEDVTVGLDTQQIVARDGGLPRDAAGEPSVSMDGATAPEAGAIPPTDSGLPGDSGLVIVDAGPCAPNDCFPVQIGIAMDSKALICATGEDQVCMRNSAGECEMQCPVVPPDQSCSAGVFLQKCASDTFCRHDIGDCNGESGACEVMPSACDKKLAPVCGCDGVTYDSACQAFALGVNLADVNPCP